MFTCINYLNRWESILKLIQFTVKISGGPDGDVAGNQIYNLARFYPKTAKLVAITDVSGTMYDPEGLDLDELTKLIPNRKIDPLLSP
jgi:Glutamate dehydrogenase/leucine dehydrogenase